MNSVLHGQFDYPLLCGGTVLFFGVLFLSNWRGRPTGTLRILVGLLVVAVLVSGWFFVEGVVRMEKMRMEQMVEGYAPTYARELGRLGHQQITPATSPDDTHYFQMIDAEKRWLAANPAAGNIYTLRKLPGGSIVRIVDSKRAARDGGKIGEAYARNASSVISAVLSGQAVFVEEPYEDRGISWVSALVPVPDFRGDPEAVLGVDFDARRWLGGIARARRTAIGGISVVLLLIAAGCAFSSYQNEARDLKEKVRASEVIRLQQEKLEMLVNSIDGIVWEADARTFEFIFVSRQAERILGYPPEMWMAAKDFWKKKLHPEDGREVERRALLISGRGPFNLEYRMIAQDGRTVWIRESAAVMLNDAGDPLLLRGVFQDISEQKRAAAELEEAHLALIDSSRHAGMAEVATGVLHNVGNVLNSVNVAGNVISERLRTSKVIELNKVSGLLTLQAADFAGFVERDPRGKHIPELIACVAKALQAEHADLLEEVETITRNISHIKEIVSMQQGLAKGKGLVEPFAIQRLVDDAIKINAVSLARHNISVIQAYEEVPDVMVDKHMVLQILVNLLSNAKQAIDESRPESRRVVVRIQNNGGEFIKVAVEDNGIGIAQENLNRIFSHGFTTKKSGHGFGLHSSALAASEMGGSLSVHSEGPGKGATFTLALPLAKTETA